MKYRAAMRLALRMYLEGVLAASGGNRTKAAAAAGISRTTFFRLAARAGFELPSTSRSRNRGNQEWQRLSH